MGIDLAKAALDAGHQVVGTARDAAKVTDALRKQENLLAVSLDVTRPDTIQAVFYHGVIVTEFFEAGMRVEISATDVDRVVADTTAER